MFALAVLRSYICPTGMKESITLSSSSLDSASSAILRLLSRDNSCLFHCFSIISMPGETTKLTLYRGGPDTGMYSWSPFVTKVEFRLRQAGLRYEVAAGKTMEGPKGKVPYVDLGPLQDEVSAQSPSLLGDSTLIIQRLVSTGHLPELNGGLSEEQKLNDLAIRALLEDKLYFYQVRSRSVWWWRQGIIASI